MQGHRSAIEKETFEESLFFCLYTIYSAFDLLSIILVNLEIALL